MNQSVLNSNNQNQVITVLDCQSATCQTESQALAKAALSIMTNIQPGPAASVAYPYEKYNFENYPSAIVIGVSPDRVLRNSFNALRMSGTGLDWMNAQYGLLNVDSPIAIDGVTATVASAAAAWVSTTASPNTDHLAAWAFNTRLRLFARLVRFTVPANISRIEFQPSGVASAYPELMSVQIKEDDCREITVLLFQRAQSYRFVGKSTNPNDQLTLMYQLPTETNHCENGVTGGSLFLQFRVFDYSGAQVVANVVVDIWQIPYTAMLNTGINANKGISGGTVIWSPSQINWNIPNLQPLV